MFGRQVIPKGQKSAIRIMAVVISVAASGLLATPALSATDIEIPCKEATEASLSVSLDTLVVSAMAHSAPVALTDSDSASDEILETTSTTLLGPRAEAAIRDAFEQSDESLEVHPADTPLADAILKSPMAGADSKTVPDVEQNESVEIDTVMKTTLPGISDDELSRFKKQMFRRDI